MIVRKDLSFQECDTGTFVVYRNQKWIGLINCCNERKKKKLLPYSICEDLEREFWVRYRKTPYIGKQRAQSRLRSLHSRHEETRKAVRFKRENRARTVFHYGLEVGRIRISPNNQNDPNFYFPNWVPDQDLCNYLKIPYFESCRESCRLDEIITMTCIRASRYGTPEIKLDDVMKGAEKNHPRTGSYAPNVTYMVQYGNRVTDKFDPNLPHDGVKVILNMILQHEQTAREKECS